MISRILTFFVAVSLTAPISAQEVLTLKDAVRIALTQNSQLKKTENTISQYETSVLSAWGGLIPTLSASGSWGWTRSEEAGGPVNFGGTVITLPASTSESRQWQTRFSSNITLFNGLANYSSISASENNLESAVLNFERVKEDIVFSAIENYYTLIHLQELIRVRREDLKWNQKNLEVVQTKNELGAVTIADVYQQQVNVGNSELALIKAENTYETSKSDFLYYLGLDVLEGYKLEDPDISLDNAEIETGTDYDLQELIDQAFANRKDYRSKEHALESSYDQITIARSGHYPSLTGSGSYTMRGDDISTIDDTRSTSFGLTLSVPIFSGWSVSERVEQAVVYAKNTEIELTDLEREIKKDIQKVYLDLQAAEKQLDVSRKSVTAAAESKKIEEEKYNLGSTTLLDVLRVNSDYINAKTSYLDAYFSYKVLEQKLVYYIGLLDYSEYE